MEDTGLVEDYSSYTQLLVTGAGIGGIYTTMFSSRTVAKWDLSGPGWYLSVPILVQKGKGTSGSINVWHCADTWSGGRE